MEDYLRVAVGFDPSNYGNDYALSSVHVDAAPDLDQGLFFLGVQLTLAR